MIKNKKTHSSSNNLRFAILAVDAVCFRISNQKLQILLGKVNSDKNIYNGYWAHIGGLVRVDETAEQSMIRLLKDKANIKNAYLEQLYTFSEIKRDPRGRVVSVAYIALLSEDNIEDVFKSNVETIWKNVKSIPKLAYDHNFITKTAVDRLKSKILYTDLARYFLPKEFTLSDLQKVYEIVLGKNIDKRNFRKKVSSFNNLSDTNKKIKKGVMRPASLYKFNNF